MLRKPLRCAKHKSSINEFFVKNISSDLERNCFHYEKFCTEEISLAFVIQLLNFVETLTTRPCKRDFPRFLSLRLGYYIMADNTRAG